MYNYPLKCRLRVEPELIVEFNSLTSGTVISTCAGLYKVGAYVEEFCPHNDSTTWELMEGENPFAIHDGIADRFMGLLFLSGVCTTEPTGLRESIESLLYDYQITPHPEPIYEWRWVLDDVARTEFMTDEEFEHRSLQLFSFSKDESTKRVRQ